MGPAGEAPGNSGHRRQGGMTRMGWLVACVVRGSARRPRLTVALWLVLAVLAAAAAHRLDVSTGTLDLLPSSRPFVQLYREHLRDFGELEDVIVAVQAPSPDDAKTYAARLVRELRPGGSPVRRVIHRVEPGHLGARALLYLPLHEIEELRDAVLDREEFLQGFAAAPGIDRLVEEINRQFASALASHFLDLGLGQRSMQNDVRFLRELVGAIEDQTRGRPAGRSLWTSLLPTGGDVPSDAGYFFSDDKRLLFVLVEPATEDGAFARERAAVEAVRDAIGRLRREFPAVEAGVTGTPALSSDEMTMAVADSRLATVVAFALTLALLLAAFGRRRRPMFLLAVLAVSLVCSVGLAAVTVGHLTLFSVMFVPIVIGLGIDYGIYVLFRYEEELKAGRSIREALEITGERSGPAILLSGLAAAVTFYVLMLTEFRGIREFGFLAGTALLVACLAMLTLCPALLALGDARRPAGGAAARGPDPILAPIGWIGRHRAPVLLAALGVTVASVLGGRGVGFDHDLLNLQAEGTESVSWERKIQAVAGRSAFTALAVAHSWDELESKQRAFGSLASVSEIGSALSLLPAEQADKIEALRSLGPVVEGLRFSRPPGVSVDRLIAALTTLHRRLGLAAAGEESADARELAELRGRVAIVVERLRHGERTVLEGALRELEHRIAGDLAEALRPFREGFPPALVRVSDLPEELRRRYVAGNGHLLLEIHSGVDLWLADGLARFVGEIRSVDADVTGPAVAAHESMQLMERAYRQGAALALVLVTVMVALWMRRLRETVLVLLPLVLGTLWTLGVMRVAGVSFNFANVWALPLIMGASAEYGVNLVTRAVEARAAGAPPIGSETVRAVLLNGLTTMAGFGSLLVAHHQGIWSLGLLLTVGTGASLAAALIVLPALLPAGGVCAGGPGVERAPGA